MQKNINEIAHVIGNGDSTMLYTQQKRFGYKLCCNQVSFDVPDKWATFLVDFRVMNFLKRGYLGHPDGGYIPGKWILGQRPQLFMQNQNNSQFYMATANQIKEFYTVLPDYVYKGDSPCSINEGYTRWNCGHMATHYACNKLKVKEVHLYGFDSIMDFNISSFTDINLRSNKDYDQKQRLSGFWRPIWEKLFPEFPDVQFFIHYKHDSFKIKKPNNCEVVIY